MISPIYSIQREVIKRCLIFKVFKVSNLAFAFWFHQKKSSFFSFDISFSQMAAKSTFNPVFTIGVISLFYRGRVKYIDLILS